MATIVIILHYYIDMSVLLENIPLVKLNFIKTTSGTWVHSLTCEFINDVISVYFPVKHLCLGNKKNISRRLDV